MKSHVQLAVGLTDFGCIGEIGWVGVEDVEPLTRELAGMDAIFGKAHSSTANATASGGLGVQPGVPNALKPSHPYRFASA
jgi:hypothetical protein